MEKHFSLILILLVLSVFVSGNAFAAEAIDLTGFCELTSGSLETDKLHDYDYTTCWTSKKGGHPSLEIKLPEGEMAAYLYVCFGEMPPSWRIETMINGQWSPYLEGPKEYLHALVPLNASTHFRLIESSGRDVRLKINELYVFSQGVLPNWVQRWEPTHGKADLLLLVAHPDDEHLFFGGTIPTYAAEKRLRIVVAYMSSSNTTRSSELLNGLWHAGLRSYPVLGSFFDYYSNNLSQAYENWSKRSVRAFVMELIRRYKPEVMLTHDIEGEYGHGAHRLCADVAQYCVSRSADETILPTSAEKYGIWDVKKLYLHLYPENRILMNWRIPLEAFGGKTSLELAKEAYALHVSQQYAWFSVEDTGEYSCSEFGLAYSLVGDDVEKNDFFENICPSMVVDQQSTSCSTGEICTDF